MSQNSFKSHNHKPLDPRLLTQLLMLSCMVVGALLPELAFAAGTGGASLDPAWTTIEGIITGAGGRIITGVSFLGALIGSVWGFNVSGRVKM